MTAITADRLLSDKQTAATLGVSVATVWRWATAGKIPKPVKLDGATRWVQSEIQGVIKEAKAQREAAAA